ncbi:hypothetical protein ACFLRC_02790 [Candidatus Altiarchaeota archaeon]
MNVKRIVIATVVGFLFGLFCVSGMVYMGDEIDIGVPITAGLIASTLYNRVLIGFVVGIADGIPLRPLYRGALIGIVVGTGISIFPLVDGMVSNGLMLYSFHIVYGIIADVVATKFSK